MPGSPLSILARNLQAQQAGASQPATRQAKLEVDQSTAHSLARSQGRGPGLNFSLSLSFTVCLSTLRAGNGSLAKILLLRKNVGLEFEHLADHVPEERVHGIRSLREQAPDALAAPLAALAAVQAHRERHVRLLHLHPDFIEERHHVRVRHLLHPSIQSASTSLDIGARAPAWHCHEMHPGPIRAASAAATTPPDPTRPRPRGDPRRGEARRGSGFSNELARARGKNTTATTRRDIDPHGVTAHGRPTARHTAVMDYVSRERAAASRDLELARSRGGARALVLGQDRCGRAQTRLLSIYGAIILTGVEGMEMRGT